MNEKKFEFGDGSIAVFSVDENGTLHFFIQARHLGREVKTTSTTVSFTKEESVEFFKWVDSLAKESN